jgi:hypothetical protein
LIINALITSLLHLIVFVVVRKRLRRHGFDVFGVSGQLYRKRRDELGAEVKRLIVPEMIVFAMDGPFGDEQVVVRH